MIQLLMILRRKRVISIKNSSLVSNRKKISISKLSLNNIIFVVFFVVLIFMVGGNSVNPDIDNYIRNYYSEAQLTEGAFLYYFLRAIFISLNVEFKTFRLFLYSVGYIILFFAILRITSKKGYALLMYSIFLMMIDSTQTYNFLGMCFLVLGFSFLIKPKRNGAIEYCICILLATGFHIIFLLYLPFVMFTFTKNKTRQLIHWRYIAMALCLLVPFVNINFIQNIGEKILDYFNLSNYNHYFESRTNYGHFIPILIHIVTTCFFSYLFSKARKNQYNCLNTIRLIFLFNLFGFCFFILFRFQLSLTRLIRNIYAVNIIGICVMIQEAKNTKLRRTIIFLSLLLAMLYGYYFVYSQYFDTIVKPFFENNYWKG